MRGCGRPADGALRRPVAERQGHEARAADRRYRWTKSRSRCCGRPDRAPSVSARRENGVQQATGQRAHRSRQPARDVQQLRDGVGRRRELWRPGLLRCDRGALGRRARRRSAGRRRGRRRCPRRVARGRGGGGGRLRAADRGVGAHLRRVPSARAGARTGTRGGGGRGRRARRGQRCHRRLGRLGPGVFRAQACSARRPAATGHRPPGPASSARRSLPRRPAARPHPAVRRVPERSRRRPSWPGVSNPWSTPQSNGRAAAKHTRRKLGSAAAAVAGPQPDRRAGRADAGAGAGRRGGHRRHLLGPPGLRGRAGARLLAGGRVVGAVCLRRGGAGGAPGPRRRHGRAAPASAGRLPRSRPPRPRAGGGRPRQPAAGGSRRGGPGTDRRLEPRSPPVRGHPGPPDPRGAGTGTAIRDCAGRPPGRASRRRPRRDARRRPLGRADRGWRGAAGAAGRRGPGGVADRHPPAPAGPAGGGHPQAGRRRPGTARGAGRPARDPGAGRFVQRDGRRAGAGRGAAGGRAGHPGPHDREPRRRPGGHRRRGRRDRSQPTRRRARAQPDPGDRRLRGRQPAARARAGAGG